MNVGSPVELIGDYFGDSYAETEPHRKAIGWPRLIIGGIIGGRAAPFKIDFFENNEKKLKYF